MNKQLKRYSIELQRATNGTIWSLEPSASGGVCMASEALAIIEEQAREVERLRAALIDCVGELEYLFKARDSDYARPDKETIRQALAALTAPQGDQHGE